MKSSLASLVIREMQVKMVLKPMRMAETKETEKYLLELSQICIWDSYKMILESSLTIFYKSKVVPTPISQQFHSEYTLKEK